jgi:beta-glucosidase
VKVLRAFQRVTLQPGERRTVRFRLEARAFAIWNDRMQEVVEPGLFTLMAGPDSVNLRSAELEIVGAGTT